MVPAIDADAERGGWEFLDDGRHGGDQLAVVGECRVERRQHAGDRLAEAATGLDGAEVQAQAWS
jgi:hypothetical protein